MGFLALEWGKQAVRSPGHEAGVVFCSRFGDPKSDVTIQEPAPLWSFLFENVMAQTRAQTFSVQFSESTPDKRPSEDIDGLGRLLDATTRLF